MLNPAGESRIGHPDRILEYHPERNPRGSRLQLVEPRIQFRLGVARKEQRQMQFHPQLFRLHQAALQLVAVERHRQSQIHAQVREAQSLQSIHFPSRQGLAMAGQAQTQGRLGKHRSGRQGELRRPSLHLGQDFFLFRSQQRHRHRLSHAGSHFDAGGSRQIERCAVGFVGSVGPIALVLHLEDFPIKSHLRPHARHDLMGQGPDLLEGLMRRNVTRKSSLLQRAIDPLDRARLARAFQDRMEDANPDPIAQKGRARLAIEDKRDPPRRLALNLAAPGEINRALPPLHVKRQVKRCGVEFCLEVGHSGWNRPPILIADRRVNAADHLVVAQAHGAKEADVRLENRGQWSRPQTERRRTQFRGATVKDIRR